MKPIKPATENKAKRKPSRKSLANGEDPATKRKRHTQNKSQAAPQILACFSCGQTDVPLIKGGRKYFNFTLHLFLNTKIVRLLPTMCQRWPRRPFGGAHRHPRGTK